MAERVFISYRREDSRADAGRLYETLSHQVGSERLFKDVDNIPLGKDFRGAIEHAISESSLVLLVIGESYATGQSRARLHSEDDPVRFEIERALSAGVPIIPVLMAGARMPAVDQLPASLSSLCFLNAASLDHDSWARDCEPIVAAVRDHLAPCSDVIPESTNTFRVTVLDVRPTDHPTIRFTVALSHKVVSVEVVPTTTYPVLRLDGRKVRRLGPVSRSVSVDVRDSDGGTFVHRASASWVYSQLGLGKLEAFRFFIDGELAYEFIR